MIAFGKNTRIQDPIAFRLGNYIFVSYNYHILAYDTNSNESIECMTCICTMLYQQKIYALSLNH